MTILNYPEVDIQPLDDIVNKVVVSFTGTRKGMTNQQGLQIIACLKLLGPDELHHGGCRGSDKEFHVICRSYKRQFDPKVKIYVHPGDYDQALEYQWEDTEKVYPIKNYLERNHDLVDVCTILLATPGTMDQELRSGTWATIRYCWKKRIHNTIVWPNGRLENSWK